MKWRRDLPVLHPLNINADLAVDGRPAGGAAFPVLVGPGPSGSAKLTSSFAADADADADA